ncbi:helix-turn-helix domain-containing protein [Jiangella alkaliphila]|uniref:Transcriptional regulator, contains XRE-family HTH domain n=1 Tax=Jiangella alkaliphila TaxID=419479 RepID=A0A1H2L1A5_9ACTN|nr:helix-turn-helix transcriptional regulator [Jiangella alkaliphila]SDU74582.1 Transcriptional regulator, contains XRE-family HTH domain [Jiangella alkaliphila]
MIEKTVRSVEHPGPAQVPAWGHEGAHPSVRAALFVAGTVLRTARAHAGLSQRELAERAGVALSSIVKTEAARSVPSWSTMMTCLEACGVRLAFVTPDGEVVLTAPLVLAPDAAGRHYPSHLPVWAVERDEQWWDSHPLRRAPVVPRERIPRYSYRLRSPGDEGKARWERDP